jgi:hypothetical protein
MKKILFLNVLVMAFAAFLFLQRPLSAQTSGFFRVFPLVTAAGQVGFFDQQDGKLYVYDAQLEDCIFIVQLDTLGEPLKKIKFPGTKIQKD